MDKPDVNKKFCKKLYKTLRREKGIGKKNAITTYKLAKLMDIEITNTNERIRFAMKRLRCEFEKPVVSCSKGMYIARNREEVLEYKEDLNVRMLGLEKNIRALDKILEARRK